MGFEMKHGTKLREFSQQQLPQSFSNVLNSLLSTFLLLKHGVLSKSMNAKTTINLCICFPPTPSLSQDQFIQYKDIFFQICSCLNCFSCYIASFFTLLSYEVIQRQDDHRNMYPMNQTIFHISPILVLSSISHPNVIWCFIFQGTYHIFQKMSKIFFLCCYYKVFILCIN